MAPVDAILETWRSGGWVMIPLFLLAVLLYTQAFELVMQVRRSALDGEEGDRWREWLRHPEDAPGRTGEVIRYTQAGTGSAKDIRGRFDEVRRDVLGVVDRRTRFVSTLVSAAPLLGLLGTVIGMLRTFLGIATSAGGETAGVIAAGISEALVTTQTGLTIALPGLFVVMVIRRQRHRLEAQLARLESLTLVQLRFE